ncbi:MAG: phosphatidylinositol mannoside acyltransferase [Propionibacteriales bacterium]|nr:phosphatidylinositol mannoside acyltransferase [Propionibacteriales bacterium]
MTPSVPSRERFVDSAFGLGWAITRHAPEPAAARLLEGAADRMCKQNGAAVQQLQANLRRAVPDVTDDEMKGLCNEALRSYFRYWHEAFRLPAWTPSRIVDSVVTVNEAPLRAGYAGVGGAIIALPHMANWDHAGAWACLTGMPVTTVAERLKPESLFARFVRYREELGMQVLPLTGDHNPLTELRTALRDGRLVCLVADRDIGRSGIEVQLLGEPALLPGGPATLARMTGAPLVAATLTYQGPLLRIEFSDPLPVRRGREGVAAMTQDIADVFSAGIAAAPADWHMLQPVFTADLDTAAT